MDSMFLSVARSFENSDVSVLEVISTDEIMVLNSFSKKYNIKFKPLKKVAKNFSNKRLFLEIKIISKIIKTFLKRGYIKPLDLFTNDLKDLVNRSKMFNINMSESELRALFYGILNKIN